MWIVLNEATRPIFYFNAEYFDIQDMHAKKSKQVETFIIKKIVQTCFNVVRGCFVLLKW